MSALLPLGHTRRYELRIMRTKLDFKLISEIVSHGAGSNVGVTVDPSTSVVLSQAGLGMVTTYLEQLALKEILIRHNIPFEPKLMVGQLIKAVKEKVPAEYVDPALSNIVDLINKSRNTAVHTTEKIPIPSRDQAIMVIFAMRDVVRRNLSHS